MTFFKTFKNSISNGLPGFLPVVKKTIGFVFFMFVFSMVIEYATDRNFTAEFFIKKIFSNLLAGVFYFFILYYFSKKSK